MRSRTVIMARPTIERPRRKDDGERKSGAPCRVYTPMDPVIALHNSFSFLTSRPQWWSLYSRVMSDSPEYFLSNNFPFVVAIVFPTIVFRPRSTVFRALVHGTSRKVVSFCAQHSENVRKRKRRGHAPSSLSRKLRFRKSQTFPNSENASANLKLVFV